MKTLTSLVLLASLLFSTATRAADGPFDHVVIPIKEGIWLLQRPEPTRQPVEGNITVVEGGKDLLVIDTGGTPLSGLDAISLIRQLSDKPVRWIVNTHWHGDHHLGNSVFREAWPKAQIIAHSNTARDMTGEAMNYLDGQDVQIQASLDRVAQLLESGVDTEGNPLDAAQKERYQGIQNDLEQLLEGLQRIELVGANRTFLNSLELNLGGRNIQILHPGRGNTEGDAVVFLPDDGIVISGDLVVHPTPYGFHSYPDEWVKSLAFLRNLEWEILIPGHGDPMNDASYLNTLSVMITSMRAQASAAVAAGQDLEAYRETLDIESFKQEITGNNEALKPLFQAWWVEPFSKSAWLEASGLPIIQGDDGH